MLNHVKLIYVIFWVLFLPNLCNAKPLNRYSAMNDLFMENNKLSCVACSFMSFAASIDPDKNWTDEELKKIILANSDSSELGENLIDSIYQGNKGAFDVLGIQLKDIHVTALTKPNDINYNQSEKNFVDEMSYKRNNIILGSKSLDNLLEDGTHLFYMLGHAQTMVVNGNKIEQFNWEQDNNGHMMTFRKYNKDDFLKGDMFKNNPIYAYIYNEKFSTEFQRVKAISRSVLGRPIDQIIPSENSEIDSGKYGLDSSDQTDMIKNVDKMDYDDLVSTYYDYDYRLLSLFQKGETSSSIDLILANYDLSARAYINKIFLSKYKINLMDSLTDYYNTATNHEISKKGFVEYLKSAPSLTENKENNAITTPEQQKVRLDQPSEQASSKISQNYNVKNGMILAGDKQNAYKLLKFLSTNVDNKLSTDYKLSLATILAQPLNPDNNLGFDRIGKYVDAQLKNGGKFIKFIQDEGLLEVEILDQNGATSNSIIVGKPQAFMVGNQAKYEMNTIITEGSNDPISIKINIKKDYYDDAIKVFNEDKDQNVKERKKKNSEVTHADPTMPSHSEVMRVKDETEERIEAISQTNPEAAQNLSINPGEQENKVEIWQKAEAAEAEVIANPQMVKTEEDKTKVDPEGSNKNLNNDAKSEVSDNFINDLDK